MLFLGWHPGTTEEIFSIDNAIKEFNLKNLNKRGAVYSLEKLNWYNNYYIQKLESNEFDKYAWKVLKKSYNLEEKKKDWCKQVINLFRVQLNYFQELVDLTSCFFKRPNKQFLVDKDKISWLSELKKELDKLNKWEEENIRNILKISASSGCTPKKDFFILVRKILTGKDKGPELPKIIFLLGNSEIRERLS